VTCGDCFAGIGGMSLGLERAGFTVRWQVEHDPVCGAVLRQHWPAVRHWGNVRSTLATDLDSVDLIAGSPPCQDLSSARTRTHRRGLNGDDSGLWGEQWRLVDGVRPQWVLVENTPDWRRWMPYVRADLAHLGYASLPLVVSAGTVGAPHSRPRGFVLAYADPEGEPLRAVHAEVERLCAVPADAWRAADLERAVGMDDGLPGRMDRLRALGNAVCPQVIEVIGRAILTVEAS
jgi:DNA (cytosine-5)-methyltransferase 1